ncbi:MAG: OmpP1/FadL family transporter [Oligoflexus sp.]
MKFLIPKFSKRPLYLTALAGAMLPTGLHAGGYQILEKNASDLGRAFAGNAAIAEDATTIGSNPAGLSLLDKAQFSFAISTISGQAKVELDEAGVFVPGVGLRSSPGKYKSGNIAPSLPAIPAFYASLPLNEKVAVGFGAFSNFSTGTTYDQEFAASILALESEVQTINLNPSLSYRWSDKLSIGFGLNAVIAEATLSASNPAIGPLIGADGAALLNADGAPLIAPTGSSLGYSEIKGDDLGFGWNLGAIYELSEFARIGLAYRSPVNMTLVGTSEFRNTPDVDAFTDFNAEAPLDLPDILSASAYVRFLPFWSISADVTRTGWSRFQDLQVYKRTDGSLQTYVDQNWKDSYRYALGTTHYYSQQFKLRAGVAYDQSPIPDATRTFRIPTGDMTWLALGGQYRFNQALVLDGGYARLLMNEVPVDDERVFVGQAFTAQARGRSNLSADVFSLQVSYLL